MAIDRHGLTTRHNPRHVKPDAESPLSVGNGEFAFTADVTGMQTFYDESLRGTPLCTQSQWGWHTSPKPAGMEFGDFRMSVFDTPRGPLGFPLRGEGQKALYAYLRQNPHRVNLARIGMVLTHPDGRRAALADLSEIDQTLDLWNGVLTSRFRFAGEAVTVLTACHPEQDQVVFAIESPLVRLGALAVEIAFPGPSPNARSDTGVSPVFSAAQSATHHERDAHATEGVPEDTWSLYISGSDWAHPERHGTTSLADGPNRMDLVRTLDADRYHASIEWRGDARAESPETHRRIVRPRGDSERFEIVCAFAECSLEGRVLPSVSETLDAARRWWNAFWTEGGAIDLSGSADPRAPELERRIVLSQYLTAIQCSGSRPPQETGLTTMSWYGKFNLEMHWWHAFHFPLWGRPHLLERSMEWYLARMPLAREMARKMGLDGARWVKMYGPEGWDDCCPSPISPLLIWCQPHPIAYAEILYRAHPTRETLDRYARLVFDTAEFMAAFASWDQESGRYVLPPPIHTVQEVYPPREALNPVFELAYWRYGLEIAQRWRERLGLGRCAAWDIVLAKLAPLPVHEGVYVGHENAPDTFTKYKIDHPSMLMALGCLPGWDVDRETMRRTLHKVLDEWDLGAKSWGWDYAMIAMCAARLGEPEAAIDALFSDLAQNRFLANGHNPTRQDLPLYLPANGALLIATAMMAAGWDGSPPGADAPGFPKPPGWVVRNEGLNAWL
ncbi:glycoside hydrolase family 65 [Candidatus Sumerlaeota bacterium]|nr:glycoside hydrolase family 65 [Candidatus Sumerlaeota bacterium]